jgi:hypothetical protein
LSPRTGELELEYKGIVFCIKFRQPMHQKQWVCSNKPSYPYHCAAHTHVYIYTYNACASVKSPLPVGLSATVTGRHDRPLWFRTVHWAHWGTRTHQDPRSSMRHSRCFPFNGYSTLKSNGLAACCQWTRIKQPVSGITCCFFAKQKRMRHVGDTYHARHAQSLCISATFLGGQDGSKDRWAPSKHCPRTESFSRRSTLLFTSVFTDVLPLLTVSKKTHWWYLPCYRKVSTWILLSNHP